MNPNAMRIGELCSEIFYSHQDGTLTKRAFVEMFADVVRLSGHPPEDHSVLMGCAADPTWLEELRGALRGAVAA